MAATTSRQTRSSVLGKRSHAREPSSSTVCEQQLATPDPTPNPKRARTSTTLADGEGNKENISPLNLQAVSDSPLSTRAARALRRTTTETSITLPCSQAIHRRTSTSSLPATSTAEAAIAALCLNTPPSTPRLLQPIHARARALLRPTCNDAAFQIAGRAQERNEVEMFLRGASSASSLYISGTPGTGKTALVNAVLSDMADTLNAAGVKVFTVNCMALNNIDALWDRITEDLSGSLKRRGVARKATRGLEGLSALLARLDCECILVLDELDHIASSSTVLSSLFSLPMSNSSLRLIGIANTHTLTSEMSSLPQATQTRVQTLHFAAYTPAQLLEILNLRLNALASSEDSAQEQEQRMKFLAPPALNLLTKKIASMTGDVRALFEVLRRAIDLAVASSFPTSPTGASTSRAQPQIAVTPSHILAGLKAYAPASRPSLAPLAAPGASSPITTGNSETANKVRNLGLQARLVLMSLLIASRRLDASLSLVQTPSASPVKRTQSLNTAFSSNIKGGVDGSALHSFHVSLLGRDDGPFSPVGRGEWGDLVNMLEGVGLVTTSGCLAATASPTKGGARRAFGRSTSFAGGKASMSSVLALSEGTRGEEVLRGLGICAGAPKDESDVMEEEVRAIWHREMSRLARDVKARERNGLAKGSADAFDDAEED